MPYTKPQLSIWERAVLVAALLRVFANGFYASLTGAFRGSSGSARYKNHVKLAMLRTFLAHTSVRQQQALGPSLDEIYPAFAKEKGFKPEHITLADGTKAYWIGNPSAETTIIWFHGGGYNLPPEPGHLNFAYNLVSSAGPSLSVLMLAYTLAPHETYPYQLRQAVECLRYVLTDLKQKPENISLGGDSAGANLAIGVLSHMMHPHKEVMPLQLEGGAKLASAILLAAWCSFRTDWPSSRYNAKKDIVSPNAGNQWSESFLGGKEKDGYNEPLSASEGWWDGLKDVVEEIFMVGGGDEILVDPIRELARQYEAVHPKVTLVIAEGEWHDRPMVTLLGQGGEQDAAIKSFVKSRLL